MFKGFDELPDRNFEDLPRGVIGFLSPRAGWICPLIAAKK